ncbi:MAG: HAD-IA family hydrolase [Kiloniellales bacterium]|nr:HAD-IA family hydrolase [Kiloniellales bacterium]
MTTIKAILFDTFGTVVDWRGSIARHGEALAQQKGLAHVDWDAFARAWRAGYVPGMAKVRSGERPWTSIDDIHRERLEAILAEVGIANAFNEAEKANLNRIWHRLDPWPDAVPGLIRLKSRYLIAPLSNGSMTLLSTMAKRAGIPWDCIFSSNVFKAFKPDAAVYRGAIELL